MIFHASASKDRAAVLASAEGQGYILWDRYAAPLRAKAAAAFDREPEAARVGTNDRARYRLRQNQHLSALATRVGENRRLHAANVENTAPGLTA